jgi:hypothetical protein
MARRRALKWLADRGVTFPATPKTNVIISAILAHPDAPAEWIETLKSGTKRQKIDVINGGSARLPSGAKKPKIRKIPAFYSTPQWRRLRYDVLKRDGGKCQLCGRGRAEGVVLNVDHIKNRRDFPHLAMDLNNLQTLCANCNEGKGNRDDTDWR